MENEFMPFDELHLTEDGEYGYWLTLIDKLDNIYICNDFLDSSDLCDAFKKIIKIYDNNKNRKEN